MRFAFIAQTLFTGLALYLMMRVRGFINNGELRGCFVRLVTTVEICIFEKESQMFECNPDLAPS